MHSRLWLVIPVLFIVLPTSSCSTDDGYPVSPPSDATRGEVDAFVLDVALGEGRLLDGGGMQDRAGALDGAADRPAVDYGARDVQGLDLGGTDRSAADHPLSDRGNADLDGVDAGLICTQAEDCVTGLGCVSAHCQACRGGDDCRSSLLEGCSAGVCGTCGAASDCAAGLACHVATGECDVCRVATECRTGEACVEGVCAQCSDATQCNGGLCVAGACQSCQPGVDDAACASAYGDNRVICQAEGMCAPDHCLAGIDCQIAGQVCGRDGTCQACVTAGDCLDTLRGGYASGTLCVEGVCVEANCVNSADCPNDRPVCSDAFRCRGCQASQECLDRAQVSAGFVCDLTTGRCPVGDCYPAGVVCGMASDQVCGNSFLCGACSSDVACRLAQSDDLAICEVGACVTGCVSGAICDATRVCGADHRCRDCIEDGECVAATGNDGAICEQNSCRTGCIPGSDCGSGRVCGADHRCRDCASDSECAVSLGNGDAICDGTLCVIGCATGQLCVPSAQICDTQHRCQLCVDDASCATASGIVSQICESGQCLAGCTTDASCTGNQVCKPDHRCGPCTDNSECDNANDLCVAGQCQQAECNAEKPCGLGRACDTNLYICRNCQSDNECGAGAFCDLVSLGGSGRCTPGECSRANQDLKCASHLCASNSCQSCDATHPCGSSVNGLPRVCDQGVCHVGNCTPSTQDIACQYTRYCNASYQCTACTVHGDCSANHVCQGTSCVPGNCVNASDCGQIAGTTLNQICTNNNCRPCQSDVECRSVYIDNSMVCQGGQCAAGCSQHSDCTSTNNCVSGRCMTCSSDVDCGGGRVCDERNGQCITGACVLDAECTDPAPTNDCVEASCKVVSGATVCGSRTLADNQFCDDHEPCTLGETCQAGACQPSDQTCNDGLSCTADQCAVQAGSAVCANLTVANNCAIDDGLGAACYANHAFNPQQACQWCDPNAPRANAQSRWTTAPDGTACGGVVTKQCKAGFCLKNDSQTCLSDDECVNGQCECADATCTVKLCSDVDCTCKFNADGSLGCEGFIADGADDADDTCGSGLTCNGQGGCNLDFGASCNLASACESNLCECANASCSTQVCADSACTCRFTVDGVGGCDGFVLDGVDDAQDNCGALSCNGQGACNLADGQICSADGTCESNQCECVDASCAASKLCSKVDCGCQFNTDGDVTCDGAITDGQLDAAHSCGALTCNGVGACHLADGLTCTGDSDCQSNQCECADATCSSTLCSAVDCSCRFNADGDASCEGLIGDGVDDANNTCGVLSCNGQASCNLSDNSVCVSDGACESNQCECVDATCMGATRCSAVDCTCAFNADGNNSCDGFVSLGLNDAAGSCGSFTCDGAGHCDLPDGSSCSSNATCHSGQCECADANCASKVCSAVDCPCRYNITGDASCDGNLADGFEDLDDSCGAGLTCNGSGTCNLANGSSCGNDVACESNQCECADASCTSQVCSAVDCSCHFNVDGDALCEGLIADGSDDANDTCSMLSCNGQGQCNLANGTACSSDSVCESNQCECADATCSQHKCSNADCMCTYNENGLSGCTGMLSDGIDDFADSCGLQLSCNGMGGCNLPLGLSCSTDPECQSHLCECADALCLNKVCSSVDCQCTFTADGSSGCTGNIAAGNDDASDSCGPNLSCNGQGTCAAGNGTSCALDTDCESQQCECADASCLSARCSPVDCLCQYNIGSDTSCDGNLPAGSDDAVNSCGALSCNGAGGCNGPNGTSCSQDQQCESGHCECANGNCSSRLCSAAVCTCAFNANGDATCEGMISDGYDDARDFCGPSLTCNGLGGCNDADGTPCAQDAQCQSNQCECANALCSSKVCSASNCPCGYNAAGDVVCDGNLNDGVDDGSDTCGATTCNGQGACNLADAIACSLDYECESNNCECTDASCTTKLCSAADCLCQYNVSGDQTCDGAINAHVDDGSQSCGVGATCNGAGACFAANGASCGVDNDCDSGRCECADATCSTHVCSALDCPICTYNVNGDTTCEGLIADNSDDAHNSCGASSCDGAGGCNKANGIACATDGSCSSNQCECADATCATKLCSATSCALCSFNSNGDATCEGLIADNYDDAHNGCGVHSCDGAGGCNLDDGAICTSDHQCTSNFCECTDANCTSQKKCSTVDCFCKFNTNGDSTCDGNIPLGQDDAANSCLGLACNGSGGCNAPNGTACTQGLGCQSGHCECASANCVSKVCSAVACDCQYNTTGGSACDGPIDDGKRDGSDSCGAQTCNGQGVCNLANNTACGADLLCESNQCECSNAQCATSLCSQVDCFCGFNSNGDGTCDGYVPDGSDDAPDSCGPGLSCNGQGSCNLTDGLGCSTDIECESNQCECVDTTCSTRVCSQVDCLCQYNATGDAICDGPIDAHLDDGADSCGLGATCNGGGACFSANGASCSADADCDSGQCECADAACSTRVCSAVDCTICSFNANGDNACNGLIADGTDDANNSCGTSSCDGHGACNLADAATCTFDYQCTSNQCECADATCSTKLCSAVDCTGCSFNANGDSACNGMITDGYDDANDSCGTSTCDGAGGCNKPAGQPCSADAQCTSNQCECSDANCTATLCSDVDCVCKFNTTGDSLCDGNIAAGQDDAANSCGALACNGSGTCRQANGTTCTANLECDSGFCECADATCSAKICSASDCQCTFNANGDASCEASISDGYDDAGDFCGPSLTCNGQGQCNLSSGTTCSQDSLCEYNQCECTNATCSTKVCSQVDCLCGYNASGDGACDGNLLDGVQDGGGSCGGGLSCNGQGGCNLADGLSCSTDSECESNQCECTDSVCSATLCSAADCLCQYNITGDAVCDGPVDAHVDDGADSCGAGASCNGAAICFAANGVSCSVDADCESGQCECTDATCTARVCSAVNCTICTFNANGDAACEGLIADNSDDANNSCGASSCDGAGGCNLGDGAVCVTDNQCSSNQCECADSTCSAKVCSAVDCSCRFNANGDGLCEGLITDGIDDANDTCTGSTCDGAGGCNQAAGAICTTDAQCLSNHCECTDVSCAVLKCSDADCWCRFNANGDSSCDGNIPNGQDDWDNSCGTLACDGTGNCNVASGNYCNQDLDCASGHCVCHNAACTQRVCSPNGCACTYDVDGSGTCVGNIDSYVDDATNSCGPTTCDGNGVCHVGNGGACSLNTNCESGQCECTDAACTSKVCSAIDCACQYNTTGDSACDGYLTSGSDPLNDCAATLTCNGQGGCHKGDGILCTQNAECESGQCECADASCINKKCSAVDCNNCTFNAEGDNTCEGLMAYGVDDADDSCGVSHSCDGAGLCTAGAGSPCAGDNNCDSNECECVDASCSSKVCSQINCFCMYNVTGDGTCDGDINDGVDDGGDSCLAGLTCNGHGACNFANGADCTANDLCESNQCEYVDAAATAKKCSAVDCDCQYNVTGDGVCDGNLNDTLDDPDDSCGVGLTCNGQGLCNLPDSAACAQNYECESNECECADATCTSLMCSSIDCNCKYGNGCANPIADGYDDADDTCAALSCNGQSACNVSNGTTCTANWQCETNNCECVDAVCSSRKCSVTDCVCGFNANADSSCDGFLVEGFSYPNEVSCNSSACDGAGTCKESNGAICAANVNCKSSQCECSNSTCGQKRCSAVDCNCSFNANGDSNCEGYLADFTDDADNTCGPNTCHSDGICHKRNDLTVTTPFHCESHRGVCGDRDCTWGWCEPYMIAFNCKCCFKASRPVSADCPWGGYTNSVNAGQFDWSGACTNGCYGWDHQCL